MFLTVLDGPAEGVSVPLDDPVTVGRDGGCSIVLDQDERVSRRHASFAGGEDGTVVVTDLGSTNGVFVGDERITGPVVLRSGDTIRIGRTRLAVRATDPAAGPATVIGDDPEPAAAVPPAASAAPEPGPPSPPRAAPPASGDGRSSRLPILIGAAVVAVIAIAAVAVVVLVGGDDAMSAEELTDRSRAGVLQVQSEIDGQLQGTGTGWVYDLDDGLIVTNYHVVGVGTRFSVGTGPDRRDATLIGAAPCEDLAVLRVDRVDDLIELPLLESQDELRNGQEVVALGYPGTASDTPSLVTSTGTISNPRSSFDAPALDLPRYPNVILTQTPINPGNSGGPLFDLEGHVIGVNSAGSNATQNQNYAIGVDRLREILPDLAAGDSHGWNGLLYTFPGSPEEVEAYGYDPALFGLAVFAYEAVPQSPAANTGLFRQLPGAIIPILGVDDVQMDGTLQTLCTAIGPRRRGDRSIFSVTDGVDVFTAEFGYG